MKYIKKGLPSREFVDWLDSETEDWTPTYETLQNPQKAVLRRALHEEQHGLCCYCESSIPCDLRYVHIEHLFPRSQYPERELEYGNLLLSCNGLERNGNGSETVPCHCGHLKGSGDALQMISPLDPACETAFDYTMDGRMNPSSDAFSHAESTIAFLGLNTPRLVR